jgi:DNA-binding CsgD family transcriptional regulator
MEQGNLDEADAILTKASKPEPLPRAGYWAWLMASRARLLMLQERIPEALQMWLACGHRFTAHGGQNPAVVAWRSGAALALHRLGHCDEARALASEELALARRWAAPTALGRALRVAGLVHSDQGLGLLREATAVLTGSPAGLEHAKALIDTGMALRRSGRHSESDQHLAHGVELAHLCGATPLAERGKTAFQAGGARPRRMAPLGPDSLTPSERRVAELAAAGRTTREVAAELFVSPKTVEANLTRIYRKLGISSRAELGAQMALRAKP